MTEKYTALYEEHKKLGASFTDFGGWQMPLKYTSELAEHHAVRNAAGIFDLSHMGEVWVTGPGAAAFLDYALVGKISAMAVGKAKYSLICNEDGGIIDDLITYRRPAAPDGTDVFLVVPNAGNAAVVAAALAERAAGFEVEVRDASAATSLIAVQGPKAQELLLRLVPAASHSAVTELKYYAAVEVPFLLAGTGQELLLARTGYTGEDGFELLVDAGDAPTVWEAVLEAVRRRGGLPAGLGARDSLRLEAGLPLHGSDVDADTSPLEAGLAWVVKLKKGDFIGRSPLAAQAASGPPRRLVAFEMGEAAVPRHGHPIWHDGAVAGTVTSGMKSPTLGTFIGLGYVTSGVSAPATPIAVEIRGRQVPARIVERPFYRRVRQEQTR
jgi:aminomethyltransferase